MAFIYIQVTWSLPIFAVDIMGYSDFPNVQFPLEKDSHFFLYFGVLRVGFINYFKNHYTLLTTLRVSFFLV